MIPYLAVLVTAVCGLNVMAVLVLGIALCGIIGVLGGSYDFYGWLNALGNGIVGMGELIIIAMMAGGMLEIIKVNGGIDYIIENCLAGFVESVGRSFQLPLLLVLSIFARLTIRSQYLQ